MTDTQWLKLEPGLPAINMGLVKKVEPVMPKPGTEGPELVIHYIDGTIEFPKGDHARRIRKWLDARAGLPLLGAGYEPEGHE